MPPNSSSVDLPWFMLSEPISRGGSAGLSEQGKTGDDAPAAFGRRICARWLPWRGVSWRVPLRCGTENTDGQDRSRARDARRLLGAGLRRSLFLHPCFVVHLAVTVGDRPCRRGFPGTFNRRIREHSDSSPFGVD